MANYSTLKAAVADVVKTNGTQAITGANLQSVLLSIINSVGGGGYQFKGVATPSTSPGTPDYNVAYIGGAGTYANFGTSVTVPVGSIGVFKYNGSWTKEQIALFAGVDDEPTANSDNLVKSGGVKKSIEDSRLSIYMTPTEQNVNKYVTISGGHVLQLDKQGSCFDIFDISSVVSETIKIQTYIVNETSLVAYIVADSNNNDIGHFVANAGTTNYETYIKVQNNAKWLYVNYKTGESCNVVQPRNVDTKPIEDSKNLVESGGVFNSIPVREINGSSADLSFVDIIGNTIVGFRNGHIKTKEFDSSDMDLKNVNGYEDADLAITDSNKYSIVVFKDGHIKTKNFDSKAEKTTNILMIGNSYDAQAIGYAPKIIEEALQNVNLNIVILYQGSCTIQTHLAKWNANTTYEAFIYKTTEGKWSNSMSLSLKGALNLMRYDTITIHQQSSDSRDYTTYQPYLNELLDDINDYLQYPVKFGLLLNPSYPASNISGLDGDTMESMFTKICAAAQDVLDKTIIDYIVPVGTAIANARTLSQFASMGDAGNLCSDGLHLQEGLPILFECYVSSIFFINLLSPKNGIWGSKIRPDATYAEEINKPQRTHGTNIGITDSNCVLAQKCAIAAIKNPLVVTDMNNII